MNDGQTDKLAPAVSIITCCYNAKGFIDAALGSISSQKFTSWELIIVDDGSKDGSSEVVDAFAASNASKVRVLRHPNRQNRGIVQSYRLGLSEASGQYIAFLEHDDIWTDRYLERVVALFSARPGVSICYSLPTSIEKKRAER